ncbi:MAG: hypothetical protein Q9179_005959 [Wetmoreana sp. 5 TL-2023]
MVSGQTLHGVKWSYRIVEPIEGDGTQSSLLFKASVLPKNESTRVPTWSAIFQQVAASSKANISIRAVIKTAQPDDKTARRNLQREYDTYCLPQVAKSLCFREMYDIIGDPQNFDDDAAETVPCLALEWMDSTLAKLSYTDAMHSYTIMKAIIETVLSGSVVLDGQNLVNTDTKPSNVLFSNIDTDCPRFKISDLGLVYPDGSRLFAQPYAMRAPEVFEGRPHVHRSQTWACAAMLLCWMKPGVLGLAGNKCPMFRESWCIAKIRRLFPDWSPSPIDNEIRLAEFRYSEELINDLPSDIKNITPLEDELKAACPLPEVRDLLRRLFVIDLEKRPSAAEALASEEFQALAEKARRGPENMSETL